MNKYWSKLGHYVILMLATTAFSFVADFVWLVAESALTLSPLTEGILGFGFRLLICAAVMLFFASKEGYEQRRFSLSVNLIGGGLYLLLHSGLTYLLPAVGPLGVALAELIYYGDRIAYTDIDPVPPLLCLIGTAVTDALFTIPMMSLGNWWGVWSHRQEIRDIKEATPGEQRE